MAAEVEQARADQAGGAGGHDAEDDLAVGAVEPADQHDVEHPPAGAPGLRPAERPAAVDALGHDRRARGAQVAPGDAALQLAAAQPCQVALLERPVVAGREHLDHRAVLEPDEPGVRARSGERLRHLALGRLADAAELARTGDGEQPGVGHLLHLGAGDALALEPGGVAREVDRQGAGGGDDVDVGGRGWGGGHAPTLGGVVPPVPVGCAHLINGSA
jgi:hypothetical protein